MSCFTVGLVSGDHLPSRVATGSGCWCGPWRGGPAGVIVAGAAVGHPDTSVSLRTLRHSCAQATAAGAGLFLARPPLAWLVDDGLAIPGR
jgi:hypothetical protein